MMRYYEVSYLGHQIIVLFTSATLFTDWKLRSKLLLPKLLTVGVKCTDGIPVVGSGVLSAVGESINGSG